MNVFRRIVACVCTAAAMIACNGDPGSPTSVGNTSSLNVEPLIIAIVTVSPDAVTLQPGESQMLRAVVANKHGIAQPDREVTWTSDNPAIVSVSAPGVVTAISVGGPVAVRAQTAGAKEAQGVALVTVAPLTKPFQWEEFVVVDAPEVVQGLSGTSASDVWATCGFQCLFHFDGTQWLQQSATFGGNIYRAFARSSNEAYFAGQSGIMQYEFGAITQIVQDAGDLFGVWSYSNGSGFACGDGTLLHFRLGQPFEKIPTGLTEDPASRFENGWGTSPTNMYCSGVLGIFRYDGTEVTQVVSTHGVNHILGTGENDVWAAGTNGTLLHFDGTAWASVDAGQGSDNVAAVYPVAPGAVFLSQGSALREFNGSSWAVHPLPAAFVVNDYALYAPDGNTVFVGVTRIADNASLVLRGTR